MTIWKTGDRVRITYGQLTVLGTVLLASTNGRSLFLSFEALLGGYVGQMPILMDEDGVFRDLINSQPVRLEQAAACD